MLETEVPADTFGEFSRLLDGVEGCRLLTYLDLRRVWRLPGQPFPFRQLEANRSLRTGTRRRGPASGHHLFLWVKVTEARCGWPRLRAGHRRAAAVSGQGDRRRGDPSLWSSGRRRVAARARAISCVFKGARLAGAMCGIAHVYALEPVGGSRARSFACGVFVCVVAAVACDGGSSAR